ncbi:hypothetical protein GCM10017562_64580 [Streptomyces roseofulvus]
MTKEPGTFQWGHEALRVTYGHGKAGFSLNGQGTWSSCGHLPMGGLTDRRTGRGSPAASSNSTGRPAPWSTRRWPCTRPSAPTCRRPYRSGPSGFPPGAPPGSPWPCGRPPTTYLTVWRRPGADAAATLRLPHLRDTPARIEVLHPSAARPGSVRRPDTAELGLTLPTAPSAFLLRVTPTGPGAP